MVANISEICKSTQEYEETCIRMSAQSISANLVMDTNTRTAWDYSHVVFTIVGIFITFIAIGFVIYLVARKK